MNYWLLKIEPDDYSFADLQRDGSTVWDGVANNAAFKHMRAMQPGDQALIYHTSDERQAVGLAEVTSRQSPGAAGRWQRPITSCNFNVRY